MTHSASYLSLILVVLAFMLGRETGADDQPKLVDAKFGRLEAQEFVVWGRDRGADCRIVIDGKSIQIVHTNGAEAMLASKGVLFLQSHKPVVSLGAADRRLAVYDEPGRLRASLGVEQPAQKGNADTAAEARSSLKLFDADGRVESQLPR